MKQTPGRKMRGGAQRVLKKDQETPSRQNEDIEDHEATPTERSVKKFEFQAPKYHDFDQMDQDEPNTSAWFEQNGGSPQDPHQFPPRNLLAEGRTSPSLDGNNPSIMSMSRESIPHSMVLRKRSVKNLSFGNQQKRASGVQKKTVRKQAAKTGGMTIPKPFNLATAAKRVIIKEAARDPKSPFVPLAIKLQTFQKEVAERAKPKAFGRVKQEAKLTQPKSPMLSTRLRAQHSKGPTAISTQEKEELEAKKVAPFKAKPLNRRILDTKQQIVIEKAPLTIPQSPAIQKPKPKQAPKIAPVKPLKANPVPDLSKVFVPIVDHRIIEPANFALPGDAIHNLKQKEIAEKKHKEEEELARKRAFKAKPAALPAQPFTVLHEIKVTEPSPFALNTDVRGALHQEEFADRVHQHFEQEEKARNFHANPIPASEPFIPARSNKPLTEIQSFQSHLDTRMAERKVFEEEAKLRLAQEEEAKLAMDAENKIREDKELRALRKKITHKAQPVKKFANVEIKPSNKKLTEPKTPRFVRKSTRQQ